MMRIQAEELIPACLARFRILSLIIGSTATWIVFVFLIVISYQVLADVVKENLRAIEYIFGILPQ